MIALVTDSNAQIPEELARRWSVRVVPLCVVVDGNPYREGVDLDCAEFYRRLEAGAEISTAAPAPGEFTEAYNDAAAAGATGVLSIHVGAELSGSFNAARLGAAGSPIPVQLVDTGTASFAVACSVWAAAEALAKGAGIDEAAGVARSVAGRVGNVFVVGAADLAARSGRLDPAAEEVAGVPVLALEEGKMRAIGEARDTAAAVDAMADYVTAAGSRLRVGVGDAAAPELAEQLARLLIRSPGVDEVVRYRVGPSVAAHTGLGTVGAVFFTG